MLDRRSPKIPVPRRGFLLWEPVTLARAAKAGPSLWIVAAICAAEILGLAGFSIVPALLPQFIEACSLTNTQASLFRGRLLRHGTQRDRNGRVSVIGILLDGSVSVISAT